MTPGAGKTEERGKMRDLARELFANSLAQATVERGFERHISCEHGVLRIGEDLYDLNVFSRTFVVSVGKAAHSMLQALIAQAGERFEGIVVSPVRPPSQIRSFRYFQGGHPLPNAESVHGAEAVLKSLNAQSAASLVIYLVSGGASAAIEKPIDNEISLEDLITTYEALVHSGAPIAEINAIRKHLSAIKGGRLAQAAAPARQVSIFVSDVPDATPDALGSGPTMPDTSTAEDCYVIAAKHELLAKFPASVSELFERHALEETPKSDDPVFLNCRWWTVLSNQSLLDMAKIEAESKGFAVYVDNSCDDWDYVRAADYLLGRLREMRRKDERVCLLSGGEVTVKVTNDGGIGGRNQQFALVCARKIAGENIVVLSGGTDGIDGNSPAAGAVVDGTTLARAQSESLDLGASLARFDAYPFFAKLKDAIETGPTGNNVRDLRVLIAY
jgi:hydroxypyruvate reductase